MIPRSIKRRIRPMWLATLGAAAWANRQDLGRWATFLTQAVRERNTRPLSETLTEAKVRAAVTIDPLLRRDPALRDLSVRDGIVTLLASQAGWPDPREHFAKLSRVKGISHVETSTSSSTSPDDPRTTSLTGVAAA